MPLMVLYLHSALYLIVDAFVKSFALKLNYKHEVLEIILGCSSSVYLYEMFLLKPKIRKKKGGPH